MKSVKWTRGALQRLVIGSLACAPLALLTACGGGGGGGGDTGTPVQPVASTLVITSANAKPVSADAFSNSTNTESAQTSSSFVTGVQVSASGGAGPLQLAAAARTLAGKVSALPALATGAQTSQTLQCSSGGSVTVTANVASSNGLAVGDSITVAASNCAESIDGVNETMSGTLAITIVAGGLSSNASTYPMHIGMRVDSTSFSIVRGGSTLTTNGDLTLDINQLNAGIGAYNLSGTSLSHTVATAAGSRSFTLKNYTQTLSESAGISTYSVTATIETTNSRLGTGALTYSVSTPSSLTTDSSGAYTGGSLKVAGSSSALLLTVTGTNQFQVQVDTNGDGAYDATSTTTLDELNALL